jgi:hypothetical protein
MTGDGDPAGAGGRGVMLDQPQAVGQRAVLSYTHKARTPVASGTVHCYSSCIGSGWFRTPSDT